MATGGSISVTSDEVLDHLCSVCKNKNISTKASVYCADCKDYYCNICVDFHKVIPALRNHVVLSKDAGDGGKLPSVPTSRCDRHTKNIIDMYCQDHDEVGCTKCIILEHSKKCKNLYDILEYVQTNTHIVPEFIKTVEDIENELKSRLNSFHQKQEGLQQNKKEIIDNIATNRQKLVNIIRKQSEDTIQKVEEKYNELNNELQAKITDLNNEIANLEKLLKDMKSVSHNVPQSFVFTKQSKNVASRAEQLNKDMELVELGNILEFNLDKLCENILRDETSDLGNVSMLTPRLYNLSKKNDINIEGGDIHDACCTRKGSVFFTDCERCCLHSICNETQEFKELYLPYSSFGVCCVSNREIAVGSGTTIQMIDTTGELRLTDCIQVDHDICGLYYHDDTFYVTSSDCVFKYNMYGKLLKSYSKYADGNNMFSDIYNLVVNPINKHIHVADNSNGVITIDQEGHVLNVVKDILSGPCGLCLDQYGQVFASGIRSNNIIQLSCDGRYITTVISEGLDKPTGICFDSTRGIFYISNNNKYVNKYTE